MATCHRTTGVGAIKSNRWISGGLGLHAPEDAMSIQPTTIEPATIEAIAELTLRLSR
jgi:hypothetical protein